MQKQGSGNPPDEICCIHLRVSDGRQIRIFLVDGTPGGLLTAEIMNWTGHVVAAPRSDLARLLGREETSRTGVYLLLGDDPDALGQQVTYIGEGDEVRDRLAQHARSEGQGGKDFWERAVVLTSKDANLTKAHARYLESRFITLAVQAGRSRLTNATAPALPPLPEADRSDMEYYIAQAKIVLPVRSILKFARDYVFTSPSAAAGVVTGRPANGRLDWRIQSSGMNFGEWQLRGIDPIPVPAQKPFLCDGRR